MPATLWLASEKAKQLGRLVPTISDACAFAVTARAFGFKDWFDLNQRFVKGKRSEFDEEVDSTVRRMRHQWHLRVLKATLGLTQTEAVGLRLDWQPTSHIHNVTELKSATPAVQQLPAHDRPRIAGKLTAAVSRTKSREPSSRGAPLESREPETS